MRFSSWCYKHNYFLPQILALVVVLPVLWMVFFDRTPPLVLHDGRIEPSRVYPGQMGVRIVWQAHFSGRDCPGDTQRELVDARRNLWPKLRRARGGVFHPYTSDPLEGTVTTPPLFIPTQMEPGHAQYRVTQFYYCNFMQRWLRWPIVQKSVPIPFEVIAEEVAQ